MRVATAQVFVVAMLALPLPADAGSELVTASGGGSAVARLDFQVTIPRVMALQIGPALSHPTNATINDYEFKAAVPGATRRSITYTSIRLPNGLVTARVAGRNMALALSAAAAVPPSGRGTVTYTASTP